MTKFGEKFCGWQLTLRVRPVAVARALVVCGLLAAFAGSAGLALDVRGLEENFDAAVVVDGAIVALTEDGPIVRSVDGGASFHQLRAATSPDTLHSLAAAGSVVLAGGSNGLLLRADFSVSPTTWEEVESGGILGAVRGIAHDGAGNWLAVGADGFSGVLLRSSDNATTWSAAPGSPEHPLFAVAWDTVGGQWIAVGGDGFDGAVYLSEDGGIWTARPLPSATSNLLAVAVDESGNLLAAGEEGALLLSTDGGQTFVAVGGVTVSENLQAVVSYGPNQWVVAGEGGVALSVEDGTAEFLFEPDPAEDAIMSLFVMDGSVFLVGRELIPAPLISPDADSYPDPISVTLSADVDFSIYYTVDGSLPTVDSILYNGSFEVADSLTVRAVAWDSDGGTYSPVSSAFYVIESAPEPIAAPEITPDAGSYVGAVSVTLTAGTDVSIYYTVDGSEPSTASTLYAAPFDVTESSTVRAVAWDWGAGIYSSVVSAAYEIEPLAPEISPAGGAYVGPTSVTLSAEPGATIYYTLDGTAPTTGSLVYDEAIVLEASATVRAVARADGVYSSESTASYSIRPFAPEFFPNGGDFVGPSSVTLSAQDGAEIYYTLDGSEATVDSLLYDGSFEVETSSTVRAVAFANGELSPEATAEFTIRPFAPEISPDGGDFVGPATVALSAQDGAAIYYTLDGTAPTTGSLLYEGSFQVSAPSTVRAVALANGKVGPEASANFTIRPFAPEISPNGGSMVGPTQVTLSVQDGATIYYTLDGTEPTRSSLIYSSPFTVSESRTVRAVVRANGVYSPIASADFTIRPFAPEISPNGGEFVGPAEVTLSAQVGAGIYYTVDGSEPTADSILYGGAFEVEEPLTIRAVAVANGEMSLIASADFTIRPFAPEISPNGGTFVGPEEVTLNAQSGAVVYYTLDGTEPSTESVLYESPFSLEESSTVRAVAWVNGQTGPEASAAFTIEDPDVPLRLTIDRLSATELLLTLSGSEIETLYQLQGSTDLASWFNIDSALTGTGGEMTWEVSADSPARFYRVTTDTREVAAPEISPLAGTYGESITVVLSAEAGAIYYTLDGSDPLAGALLYDGPFEVEESVTVKAVALVDGLYSPVTAASYVMEEAAPDPYDLTVDKLSDTELRLTLSKSEVGTAYQLQTSTNLDSWSNLQSPQAGTGTALIWDVLMEDAAGFFRVVPVGLEGSPSEPLRLRIERFTSEANLLTLETSAAGKLYQLQTSTDLKSWSDLGNAAEGTGAEVIWEAAIDGSSRFYRVVLIEAVE